MESVQAYEEYTIQDIYDLPEGKRAELIDGQLYMMASPNASHQRLIGDLYWLIRNYIHSKGGDCEAFLSPFGVYLHANDKTYLEPDLSVICDSEKIVEKGCMGAPDWVIEIISPSSVSHDYIRKLNLYANSGVREYWIVDYEKNRILVDNFEHDTVNDYTFQDTVKAGIYEDLEIDFKEIQI